MRIAGIISAWLLSAACGVSALAAPNETIVCKSAKHCVDIVDRHAPDAFDYQVLHNEFLRFGDKGKSALLSMLESQKPEEMARAQILLAKGRFPFTPKEQRRIAALWPRGDLDAHTAIMRSALSPLMRARVIETLSHDNSQVREISRSLIAATVKANMDFPLRPSDFGLLAKAVLSEPTPALVDLISTYDIQKTQPVFSRLLRSGDIGTTQAAYEKLFESNAKSAFETLVGTLYDLKDDETEAAFAIAALLRERHPSREDGFYLNFAKDIAEDPKMSPMGRLAGFDAIMAFNKAPKPISDSAFTRESLMAAIGHYQNLPRNYFINLIPLVKTAPDEWLGILQDESGNPLGPEILKLAQVVPSKTAKGIAAKALSDTVNYQVIISGIELVVAQEDKRAIPLLTTFKKTHPISEVRYAAMQALKVLQGETIKQVTARPFGDDFKAINRDNDYCDVDSTDFRDIVRRMPYFGPQKFEGEPYLTNQTQISSAFPLQNGWLVGYDKGEWGGALIYFDGLSNKTIQLTGPEAIPHHDSNIIAIMPVKTPKLGEFATDFWVVTGLSHRLRHGAIYRLKGDGTQFTSHLHARLPGKPVQIEHKDDDSFVLDFRKSSYTSISLKNGQKTVNKLDPKQFNPPLQIMADGSLIRACNASNPSHEALP